MNPLTSPHHQRTDDFIICVFKHSCNVAADTQTQVVHAHTTLSMRRRVQQRALYVRFCACFKIATIVYKRYSKSFVGINERKIRVLAGAVTKSSDVLDHTDTSAASNFHHSFKTVITMKQRPELHETDMVTITVLLMSNNGQRPAAYIVLSKLGWKHTQETKQI